MEINKETLASFLIYSKPIPYTNNIICYPVKMSDIVEFQRYSDAIMVRKDSIFNKKEILKMQYLQFLYHAFQHPELEEEYLYYKTSKIIDKDNVQEILKENKAVKGISHYYQFTIELLKLVCRTENIMIDRVTGYFNINGDIIDYDKFDDLRRIILIQNEVDFDIDEFINMETLNALEEAKRFEQEKRKEKSDIEDYIDSIVISLKLTEEEISNLSVRKFWRYVKRITSHEDYLASINGQMSGNVTFKEPIKHWMTNLTTNEDKYKDVKADENELRSKIQG